jgi:hypothetical protein
MKLKKQLTLSQFVDFVKGIEYNPDNQSFKVDIYQFKFDLITRYNDFLQQKPTKELIDKHFIDIKKIDDNLYLFHIGNDSWENLQFINGKCMSYDSLEEIANKSDGELKLKNVNL